MTIPKGWGKLTFFFFNSFKSGIEHQSSTGFIKGDLSVILIPNIFKIICAFSLFNSKKFLNMT